MVVKHVNTISTGTRHISTKRHSSTKPDNGFRLVTESRIVRTSSQGRESFSRRPSIFFLLTKNLKIHFFDRECKYIQTFSTRQTCQQTRYIIENFFWITNLYRKIDRKINFDFMVLQKCQVELFGAKSFFSVIPCPNKD